MVGTVLPMVGSRWNPWAALRSRPSTALVWQPLVGGGGCVEVSPDGGEVVVLDPRLSRRDRRAILAHELVHLERRVLPAGTPRPVVDREEFQVRAETVRRLVPGDDLRRFVAARSTVGPVTADLVADEFDVPVSIAQSALDRLGRAGPWSDGDGSGPRDDDRSGPHDDGAGQPIVQSS